MDALNTNLKSLGAFQSHGVNFSTPWLSKHHSPEDPSHKPADNVTYGKELLNLQLFPTSICY